MGTLDLNSRIRKNSSTCGDSRWNISWTCLWYNNNLLSFCRGRL